MKIGSQEQVTGLGRAWAPFGLILGGPRAGGEKGPLITQHRYSVAQTAGVNHKSLTSQRLSGDAREFSGLGSIPI
jgi:hypothetical protein